MTLVFAAIAPHGDLAIPQAVPEEQRATAIATQVGMAELERRCRASDPETVIVLTPHGIHVTGAMAVVTSGSCAGTLDGAAELTSLHCTVDRETAQELLVALAAADVPAVGVSYGGNVPAEAVMPMDWGTLIPLWYLGGRFEPQTEIVMVAPARDVSAEKHVDAGRVIAKVINASTRRVGLVASADQSHTHDPAGPYGGHPSAKVFDQLIVDAVEANDLGRLLSVAPGLLEDAKPDSWWQMLMLHGALGDGWRAELLSYEAPTYYGMLCAAFSRP